MKKFTYLFFIFCFSLITNTLSAQFELGTAVVSGTKIKGSSGVQLRAHYILGDDWRVTADYIHYFDGYDAFIIPSHKVTELNANAGYKFLQNDDSFVYAFLGMNYTKTFYVSNVVSTGEVGWNIGLGGQFEIWENLHLFLETKQIIGDSRQFVMAIGGIYQF